jgi:hypothetical protein
MKSRNLCLCFLFLAANANAQYTQQGPRLSPTGGSGLGASAALSADGSTAILGSPLYNGQVGAAWVYTRNNGAWTQQAKLTGGDAVGMAHQGSAVAISADGNTAVVGGSSDNLGQGAAWIYTRSNGVWSQQGLKLVGTGGVAGPGQGSGVAISADGNTALVGGSGDDFAKGAIWVFTRSGSVWSQQGLKLVGSGGVGSFVSQGSAVALSADGNTAISGGEGDTGNTGAAWVFTRSGGAWTQQGDKLVGAGAPAAALQSVSVALSADGNTALVGRNLDGGSTGAAWVFTRTSWAWAQQGGKLTGAGWVGKPEQGTSVALSGDGNTAVLGGPDDATLKGAAWVFRRNNGAWTQLGNKLVGSGDGGFQGTAVAVSADAGTILVGGGADAWVFTGPASTTIAPGGVGPASGSGTTQVFSFTFSHSAGWQSFTVFDVLIASALDGRQACYVAFVPSGAGSGSVYLVNDAGDAGGPYSGMVLPGNGTVNNSQCGITGAGSAVSASGNTMTLTLPVTFTPGFAGNKVIYVSAGDAASHAGWSAAGTWNNPGPALEGPAVSGMSPGRSEGSGAAYTFNFSDTRGWQDIAVANVLINSAVDGGRACYVAFVPTSSTSGSLFLVDDGGNAGGPYAGMVVPGTGSVSNSQCTISGAGSSVTASGNNSSLTLAIAFTQAFAGNQVFYLAARSATQNSGWQAVGTVGVR